MFTVGYILNSGQEKFHDFWKCLSSFRKATKLEKKRKTEIKRKVLPGPLTWPAQLAAWLRGPAHQGHSRLLPCASARSSWLAQASTVLGRQVAGWWLCQVSPFSFYFLFSFISASLWIF